MHPRNKDTFTEPIKEALVGKSNHGVLTWGAAHGDEWNNRVFQEGATPEGEIFYINIIPRDVCGSSSSQADTTVN